MAKATKKGAKRQHKKVTAAAMRAARSALGRLGGLVGGPAYVANHSPEERSAAARHAIGVRHRSNREKRAAARLQALIADATRRAKARGRVKREPAAVH